MPDTPEFAKGNGSQPMKEGTGIPWTNTAMGAETGERKTFKLDPETRDSLLEEWDKMKEEGLTREQMMDRVGETLRVADALRTIEVVTEEDLKKLPEVGSTPRIKDILLMKSLLTGEPSEE